VGAGTARTADNETGASFAVKLPLAVMRWFLLRPRDSIAALTAGTAVLAILVNALFMQKGPHPAPIFSNRPPPVMAPQTDSISVQLPKPRAATANPAPASPAQMRSDTVAEIQRELAKRGFYDGAADGIYGPRTDAAIRDFEQAAGLRASSEPSESLLAAIARSNVKAKQQTAMRDPIAALLAPSNRVLAIQRALSDFGYGPLTATGVYDAETRASIERFERARRRPVTGHISDQLVHELSTLTGRPLE
jgi:peptidoglycan hydrolase-like protein with peptidoglycan-binding domain